MNRATTLSALLVAVAVVAAVPDASGREATPAKVTVHPAPHNNSNFLYGLVTSPKPACRKRSIKVVRSADGSALYTTYPGASDSNADGTWSFGPDSGVVVNGFYKAVAKAKRHGGVHCSQAQSKPLFVD